MSATRDTPDAGGFSQLRTLDGPAGVGIRYPVSRTPQPGIGWVQAFRDIENAHGRLFDYANFALVPNNEPVYVDSAIYDSDEPVLRITVHDLDVEDFHTYYVGHHWVHGTSEAERT